MNALFSWRPSQQHAQALRTVLRRGTRASHHMFSVVGCTAVAAALAMWLMPDVRGALAARAMPLLSAAVQAGPERLLTGHPLPTFGPADAAQQSVPQDADALQPTAFHPAQQTQDAPAQAAAQAVAVQAASQAAQLPAVQAAAPVATVSHAASPVSLAQQIPTRQVAVDARDNHAAVSAHAQALVADYISRRYHVASAPVGSLVDAAFQTGHAVNIDPLLILAVMAIESGFNPYAESGVGAQGLMQVMSKVHSSKFAYFGGPSAALSPLANIQVGALVLKDCVARGGSVASGLRLYNGATTDDGGYGAKVLAERERLRSAARGAKTPVVTASQSGLVKVSTSTSTAAPAKRIRATLNVSPATDAAKTVAHADADTGAKGDLVT